MKIRNVSKLLVATLMTSALLFGCGSADKTAKEEVVQEAVEETVADDKTEVTSEIEEVEDTVATLEEDVEEEAEEVTDESEGTELEDYFAANPDLYDQLQQTASSNSSDDLTCTIDVKGNTIIMKLAMHETFTEEERAVIADSLAEQEDTFASIYGAIGEVYGKLCGATVKTQLVFEDASGSEILTLEY